MRAVKREEGLMYLGFRALKGLPLMYESPKPELYSQRGPPKQRNLSRAKIWDIPIQKWKSHPFTFSFFFSFFFYGFTHRMQP